MSPISSTLANASAYGYRTFGVEANSYESIATVDVGAGGASTVTFSSIPSTYQHLQIRFIGRRTTTGLDSTRLNFNSDTGANYKPTHYIIADGSTVSAGTSSSNAFALAFYTTGSDATSGIFGAHVIDVLDYANTNKYKTGRILSGVDLNGSGNMVFSSFLWMSTNAITNIVLTPNSGNFAQYSSFALYGIKG
jgi:hypothetical protein